jgi:hypothetical protein
MGFRTVILWWLKGTISEGFQHVNKTTDLLMPVDSKLTCPVVVAHNLSGIGSA